MERRGAVNVVRVAVDAMGGDHAPEEIVRGVGALSIEAPHVQTVLVGNGPQLSALLVRTRHDPERISVHHAGSSVRMDEKPAEALDARPDCSINVAAKLVADGGADALVSAGNTGASVLACARHWKKIAGARRSIPPRPAAAKRTTRSRSSSTWARPSR
jgi:glycerol-3-phosphate acyltransferase PlsX